MDDGGPSLDSLNVEEHAWDGNWYLRAFFDDGQPLGSAANSECQIDSIAQSWSVLSGGGQPARAREAMESVDTRLVRRNERLIQLFDPPFDTSELNPGYIKGYTPGVRENGGQYTHAAIWTAMAFAALDDPKRAWEMFGLLNPITHGATANDVDTYKVEPYVIAADIYGAKPYTGRGGWTWYTGSSSWMYRLITESLLGLYREGDTLRFKPCQHPEWPSYKIHYRFHETHYHISVHNMTNHTLGGQEAPAGRLLLDGVPQANEQLHMRDDHQQHEVEIWL